MALGGELIIRQFFNPIDHLLAELQKDNILGHIISPSTTGHDSWGFRNKSVPENVDIVMIGDSQTYGTASTQKMSYPSQVEALSGLTTYNLALGGYGPAHYYILAKKSEKLSPKAMTIGLYFGNDLMDVFNYVYDPSFELFKHLRLDTFSGSDTFKPVVFTKKKFAVIRDFLAHHSVIYRLITQNELFDNFRANENKRKGSERIIIRNDREEIIAILNSDARHKSMDVSNPRIQEGIRLTHILVKQIKLFCDASNIKLTIILIPTKISVYEDQVLGSNEERLKLTLENEHKLFEEFADRFDESGIHFINALIPLQEASQNRLNIYPITDGHLNNLGNTVLSKYVVKKLLDRK